ncbi:MAG: hypothetical protein ACI8WB_000104 [Phenylobacterium sp.]|jgi:hypothetical protein
MSQLSVLELRKKAEQSNALTLALLDDIEVKQQNPLDIMALDDYENLALLMKHKRKQLKVTLEDLQLQTDISLSTLKRLFANPAEARFSNVIAVLKELGMLSWVER